MKIAFVGLGHMGEPMARNLLQAGHSLTVFDVVPSRMDALTAAGAAAGTLTFMVGATPTLFERIKPIFKPMGKNIVHCGESGNGQVAKICNNMLLGISMIGVAETMSLGAALGIDPKVLAGIINTSSGRCWSSDTYNPYPGVMDAMAQQLYQLWNARDSGAQDFSAIVNLYKHP